jgi:hypothetical protein
VITIMCLRGNALQYTKQYVNGIRNKKNRNEKIMNTQRKPNHAALRPTKRQTSDFNKRP